MLKQLIYASQAVRPLTDEDLLRILNGARKKNEPSHITGMLAYRQGVFLQVLEGEESDLAQVWTIIQADPRHDNIVEIRCVPISEREFSDWSMGFANISHTNLDSLAGYSTFLEEDFSPEGLSAKPGLAMDFLFDLKYCDL